jgi:hypothetical protein
MKINSVLRLNMVEYPFWSLKYYWWLNFLPKLSKQTFRSSNISFRHNFILQKMIVSILKLAIWAQFHP